MQIKSRLRLAILVGGALGVAACAAEPGPQATGQSSDEIIGSGTFQTTAAGTAANYDIKGRLLAYTTDDDTFLWLQVSGLKPDQTSLPAHVHNDTCANGGGGHYQIDPTQPAGEANEIWLPLTANDGHGFASVNVEHVIRPDAKAVVIHDPDTKAKIACADLKLNMAAGWLQTLPAGKDMQLDIQGWAGLLSRGGRTRTFLEVFGGLNPNTTYPAHVHNAECAAGAGTHYQLDPAQPAGEANEIWLSLQTNDLGGGRARVRTDATIRLDAKSVVIHDPVTKAKIACADLL